MATEDLRITSALVIPGSEIIERFSPSGGPGGQHANKASTRVDLVFDIAASAVLSERERSILTEMFGPRVQVMADDARSQFRNRITARRRLADRIRVALRPRTQRRATVATRGSQIRRMESKRRRSDLKRSRQRPRHDN